MKTEDLNKIIQEFDSIKAINPSENWEVNFQNKLDSSRLSKSNYVSKYNLIIVALIIMNAGFILNSLKAENTKSQDKGTKYRTIANELLITSNN